MTQKVSKVPRLGGAIQGPKTLETLWDHVQRQATGVNNEMRDHADRLNALEGVESILGTDGVVHVSGGALTSSPVVTGDIANDAVTYAKIQNVSATDRLLGRQTAGAGDIEEITCTAAGRALLDDADAAAQRTTLGLGTAATQNVGTGANNVVQLDGTPKLPAVDGSALTNLPYPAASGASLVLLDTQVASGSAQLDFETGLSDTYDAYLFTLSNIAPATDDEQLVIRVKVSGTYQTTGYKRQITTSAGATVACNTNTSAAGITINLNGASAGIGNAANESLEGTVRVSNPDASSKALFVTQAAFIRADGDPTTVHSSGWYDTAGTITGIRFLMGTGNIASGRISLYGLKKA